MRAQPAFLIYRKLRKIDLAVLPRPVVQKAKIGEPGGAGTARFCDLEEIAQNRPRRFAVPVCAES